MSNVSTPRQPSYRKHKPSGQAVVTIDCRDIYLGRYGTRESKVAYDRTIAEWLANGRRLRNADPLTVAEVINRFWEWAKTHYRHADGTQTSEVTQCRYALRRLNHLYATTSAAEFGPLAFKAVRQLMIEGYLHPKFGRQNPVSRGTTNKWMGVIRRMFRWAVENEMVPPSVYHGLLAVRGLQRGRTTARESEPVCPVAEAAVNATRPYISRPVDALIDLQLLTGARPGELCVVRECDLDMSGRIWIYRPESHKTQHHGHRREIYLGPRAQEIVKPFFRPFMKTAYLFSPQDAEAERQAKRKQNRKTPLYPSHIRHMEKKRKRNRARAPRDHYDVASYRHAIMRACEKAFPLPENLARTVINGKRESLTAWKVRLTAEEQEAVRQWRRAHSWHPHQLRHNAGTALRKEFGVETARIILGHKTAFTTEIYAEADRARAMEVIGRCG